jgi:hypothetical protein
MQAQADAIILFYPQTDEVLGQLVGPCVELFIGER